MSGFLYAKLKCTTTAERGKIKKCGKIKRYRCKVKRFKAKLKSAGAKCNCITLGYYLDDGYSGTNYERPDFKRLMKLAEDGKVAAIIVKDLSRLGRDYLKTGYYTEVIFPEYDVRFIAINDDVDTSKGSNEFAPFKNIIKNISCLGRVFC